MGSISERICFLSTKSAILGEWAYQHISDVNIAIEQYDRDTQSDDFWQPK